MAAATVLTAHDAAELTTLRAELKQWEKTFAATNGGRKAGRDDIKQDVIIGKIISLISVTHHRGLVTMNQSTLILSLLFSQLQSIRYTVV
jgi:hypothetical protein